VLNHAFDRLERSFEQASRFSSDASHELKTPLTIMRGEIESALKSEVENPRIESLLDGLLAETQRLCDIVEKLLLLSRADVGALTLIKEILDFSAICHELTEDAQILAEPKRVTTEFEIRLMLKSWPTNLSSGGCCSICWITPSNIMSRVDPFLSRLRNPVHSRCFGLPIAGLESLRTMKAASSNDFIGQTPALFGHQWFRIGTEHLSRNCNGTWGTDVVGATSIGMDGIHRGIARPKIRRPR
jgi:His Kinase A (phospho-acceptor) domain